MTESLNDILKKLLAAIPEVKAAIIVSLEGIPLTSALPQGVDEVRIAALTATLLSLAEKLIIEMKRGEFDQLYIKGKEGYIVILPTGLNAVLAFSTTKDIRLGLIFLEKEKPARRVVQKIKSIMEKESITKLTIKRKYLFEIFSSDLLIISKIDGLPTINPGILGYIRLIGISTQFYDDVIVFSLLF